MEAPILVLVKSIALIGPPCCRSPRLPAVIKVFRRAGLNLRLLIDLVSAAWPLHVELSMRPRAEPIPSWVRLRGRTTDLCLFWTAPGTESCLGAHTSPGVTTWGGLVLANSKPSRALP